MHGEIWDFPGPLPESMKVNDGELARVERCTRIAINTKVQLSIERRLLPVNGAELFFLYEERVN